jgi:hypothetical protein
VPRIHTTGPLTDAQIAAIYATAKEIGVNVGLWQNTPGPNRSSFQWAVYGGFFGARKMLRYLKSLS